MGKPLNIMTVDVEDWFHILESDESPGREAWEELPLRVEANTDRLLELLDEGRGNATFFVVGWVAKRFPDMVKRIVAAGDLEDLATVRFCGAVQQVAYAFQCFSQRPHRAFYFKPDKAQPGPARQA